MEEKMLSVENLSFMEEKWKLLETFSFMEEKWQVLEIYPSWKKKWLSVGNFLLHLEENVANFQKI